MFFEKRIIAVCIVFLVLLFSSCGQKQSPLAPDLAGKSGAGFDPSQTEQGLVGKIFPLDSVKSLERGTRMAMRTVFEGGTAQDFQVKYVDVVEGVITDMPLVMLEASDQALLDLGGISAGMSGSPIIIKVNGEEKIVGAASYSYNWQTRKPFYFFATPVEKMLEGIGTQIATGSGKIITQNNADGLKPIAIPIVCTGVSIRLLERFREMMSSHAVLNPSIDLANVASAGVASSGKFATELKSGSVLTAAILWGEKVNFAAVGTATLVFQDRVYGFGHPWLWRGNEERLPIIPARIVAEFSSIDGPFKFAELGREVLGTMEYDGLSGVGGRLGKIPPSIDLATDFNPSSGRGEARTKHYMPQFGLSIQDQAWISMYGLFAPIIDPIDDNSGKSFRVNTRVFLDGDGKDAPSINRSRLYAGPSRSIVALMFEAAYDYLSTYYRVFGQDFANIGPSRMEVSANIINDELFGSVKSIIADSVARSGGTAMVGVGIVVAKKENRVILFNVPLPDTLLPGMYYLEAGSEGALSRETGTSLNGVLSSKDLLEMALAQENKGDQRTNMMVRIRMMYPDPPDADKMEYPSMSTQEPVSHYQEAVVSKDVDMVIYGSGATYIHIKKKIK